MARMLTLNALAAAAGLLLLAASGATAYDENHAFRAPLVELPQLAKTTPVEFHRIAARRALLAADPSKSEWNQKLGVERDTETRFGQGELYCTECPRGLSSVPPRDPGTQGQANFATCFNSAAS